MTRAEGIVQLDNERVRITEWRFAPGAVTGRHRHAYDYVVVPLASGRLRIVLPDGSGSFCRAPARPILFPPRRDRARRSERQ
jgi:hypothetical protein